MRTGEPGGESGPKREDVESLREWAGKQEHLPKMSGEWKPATAGTRVELLRRTFELIRFFRFARSIKILLFLLLRLRSKCNGLVAPDYGFLEIIDSTKRLLVFAGSLFLEKLTFV